MMIQVRNECDKGHFAFHFGFRVSYLVDVSCKEKRERIHETGDTKYEIRDTNWTHSSIHSVSPV